MLNRAAAEQYYTYNASLRGVLLLIEEALDILDLAEAPHEISSYLDMARRRLEACLSLEEQVHDR